MVAFVLCKLVAGLEQKAVQQIKNVRGVKDVYMTFGGWDAGSACTASLMFSKAQSVSPKARRSVSAAKPFLLLASR